MPGQTQSSGYSMPDSRALTIQIGELAIGPGELSTEAMLPDEQRGRLQSVVRLLEMARRVLPNTDDQARRCIAKAEALLRAECKLTGLDLGTVPRANPCRLPQWKVARVARFVDTHLGETITVDAIASIACLSRGHFTRAFRTTFGETPYAYVIRRRVERAQQMILATDKPLCEIALDCGLGDQPHLTRLFRRFVGMGPGAWRRLQDGAEQEDNDRIGTKTVAGDRVPLVRTQDFNSHHSAGVPVSAPA